MGAGISNPMWKLQEPALPPSPVLSNADVADRLASLAQLLSTQKENPYKLKAYQRAAAKVRTLSESIDELVRDGSDSPNTPASVRRSAAGFARSC